MDIWRNNAMVIAVLILAFPVPGKSSATDDNALPTLDSLKQFYEKSVKTLDDDPKTEIIKLQVQYSRFLKDLDGRFTREGNLEALLAVRGEAKRFENDKTIPNESPVHLPPDVVKMQTTYRELVQKLEADRKKKFLDLTQRYLDRLELLKKQLTTQSRIEEAVKVKEEITRIQFMLTDFLSKNPDLAPQPTTTTAGGEIRTDPAKPKTEAKVPPKTEPKPEPKAEPKTEPKTEPSKPPKGDHHKLLEQARENYEQGTKLLNEGQFDAAIVQLEKALRINLDAEGTKPNTATVYSTIASAYHHKADYQKAIDYSQKALKIRLEVFGESHPMVGNSYGNIGIIYLAMAENAKAREYIGKAYQTCQRKLGDNHPDTRQWKSVLDRIASSP